MRWSVGKTTLLIELYRDRRELWDPSSPHYNNRDKKREAWTDLARRLDTTPGVLHNKMQRLSVMFDLEVDRRKSQSAHEWCFYRPLLFLKDRNVMILQSCSEFGTSDDNVIEKAKVWDWVLLVAVLLTAVYWYLVTQHGYSWGLRPAQSGEPLNINLAKFVAEDKEVCSVDLLLCWGSREGFPANFAPNNLLVKNTKLSTDKLTPHSAIVTVMLSNWKQLVSQDNSSLIVVNNNTPTLTCDIQPQSQPQPTSQQGTDAAT